MFKFYSLHVIDKDILIVKISNLHYIYVHSNNSSFLCKTILVKNNYSIHCTLCVHVCTV